ncbi:MAG TPA: CBS domain-containing protein [Anaerolineales bacterium]|jgi:CBS domain-containing protein|nr:CBS domain-containing protein [Anaerolineales bacterium]
MNISRILAVKGMGVVTIHPDQTVREALLIFAQRNIGSLVVVDPPGKIVGILSERDIIRNLARDETIFSEPVNKLMTRDVITAVPEDDLTSVANTMTERRIRHLPVVRESVLIGIVSIGDVVKAQRDTYLGEVDTLQTQLVEGDI